MISGLLERRVAARVSFFSSMYGVPNVLCGNFGSEWRCFLGLRPRVTPIRFSCAKKYEIRSGGFQTHPVPAPGCPSRSCTWPHHDNFVSERIGMRMLSTLSTVLAKGGFETRRYNRLPRPRSWDHWRVRVPRFHGVDKGSRRRRRSGLNWRSETSSLRPSPVGRGGFARVSVHE